MAGEAATTPLVGGFLDHPVRGSLRMGGTLAFGCCGCDTRASCGHDGWPLDGRESGFDGRANPMYQFVHDDLFSTRGSGHVTSMPCGICHRGLHSFAGDWPATAQQPASSVSHSLLGPYWPDKPV